MHQDGKDERRYYVCDDTVDDLVRKGYRFSRVEKLDYIDVPRDITATPIGQTEVDPEIKYNLKTWFRIELHSSVDNPKKGAEILVVQWESNDVLIVIAATVASSPFDPTD